MMTSALSRKNKAHILLEVFLRLNPKLRRSFLLLTVVIAINSVLELISIASILPFISAISDPASLLNNSVLSPLLRTAGIQSQKELIVILSGFFIFAIGASALFRVVTCEKSNYFAATVGTNFNTQIFTSKLLSSYTTHLKSDSTVLLTLITNHVNYLVLGVNYFLLYLASLFTACLIVASLLVFMPGATLTFGLVILIIYIFLAKKAKAHTKFNSSRITGLSTSQIQLAQESTSSFKDIILSHHEENYIAKFEIADKELRRAVANNTIISVIPKYIIEASGFVLLACFATFSALTNKSSADTIAILGGLAISIQKLLPALQQIYSSWIHFSVCAEPTQMVLNYLTEHPFSLIVKSPDFKGKDQALSAISDIILKNVSFSYPNREDPVVSKVTLKILPGDVIGLVGETGSGKTTLQDILLSLIPPSSGVMLVNSININEVQNRGYLSRWRESLSHVPQEPYIYNSTLLNNIIPGATTLEEVDQDLLRECINIASLSQFVSTSPQGLYFKVGENGKLLSGGQKQRIALARELYKRKPIMFLDEATSALDGPTEKSVVYNLAHRAYCDIVIMIAHRLSSLVYCNKVVFLSNGKIEKCLNQKQFHSFLSEGSAL